MSFDEQARCNNERRGEEILTLLYQLLDPDAGEGWDPDAPVPDPELPIATGTDRAKGRKLAGPLLREEIEAVAEARQRDREARLKANTP